MRRAAEGGLVALVLLGLVLWMTWPLPRHLGTHVHDPAGIARTAPAWVHPDIHLTVWIVGWVARVLPTAPWRLFDAPLFHPVPDALAYSEHLLGAAPITVPAYWLGGAVFAHQTLLVAAFVLSSLAMALAVGGWTRSAPAALAAGALFALAPWRFRVLHGVHLEGVFYLPLALLAAERWLAGGRRACLVLLALLLAAQGLVAYGLAYPSFAAAAPFVAVLGLARRAPARTAAALAAVAAAGLLVAVVSLPYLRVQRSDPPPVPAVAAWNPAVLQTTQRARLASYVDARGSTYLGAGGLALAAAGLAAGIAGVRGAGAVAPRPLVAALVAAAVPLVLLSFGPSAEVLGRQPLAGLWAATPGLRAFRVPYRFGYLVALPAAALAGLAVAAVARTRAGAAGAWAAAALAVAIACVQVPADTVYLRPFPATGVTPSVYAWLAEQPCRGERCAVLEVPAGPSWEADPAYVWWTLVHGHPVVNGYSGFAPAAYPLVVSLATQLPATAAVDALARLTGARFVVVHEANLLPAERAAWAEAALSVAARFAGAVVYDVPAPAEDWRARLVDAPAGATFAGTPLAPLPPGSAAAIEVADPGPVPARGALHAAVRVRNVGAVPWPALTSRRRHRVTLALEWRTEDAPVAGVPVTTVYLPVDLAPGDEVPLAARLVAPARPGAYALVARVVQEGGPAVAGEARIPVRVTP